MHRTISPEAIESLENWLRDVFCGLERKSRGPMVDHSLRVGRMLHKHDHDPVTVFAGYTQDVLEDTDVTIDELLDVAVMTLGVEELAVDAVSLVVECSYMPDEYALPKKERKAAASARWIAHEDPRVQIVKVYDVNDNEADAIMVSERFRMEYLEWAAPLREGLIEKLSMRNVVILRQPDLIDSPYAHVSYVPHGPYGS